MTGVCMILLCFIKKHFEERAFVEFYYVTISLSDNNDIKFERQFETCVLENSELVIHNLSLKYSRINFIEVFQSDDITVSRGQQLRRLIIWLEGKNLSKSV